MPKKPKTPGRPDALPVHAADLQVEFWAFLQLIRGRHLSPALSDAVSRIEISRVDRELGVHADSNYLSILATAGLRGETFFPVPCLLKARPELLGYYRLLYGISQKEFYQRGYAHF